MKTLQLFSLLVLLLFAACTETKQAPSVILVMTDDQGYADLACHGNEIIKTPNIDAFSEESINLSNYHVGTTCAPTRAGLLTGRNCLRNGVWHTVAGCSLLEKSETTIADVFASAGYATAMYGKWHLGDNHPFLPEDRGFEETFYHKGGGLTQTPDYWNNSYKDDVFYRNGTPERAEGYCTDVLFKEAIDFIKRKKDQPFFCYLSLNAPHGPYNVPEEYYRIYENEERLKPHQKRFYGMISNIDDNFAKLRSTLEDLGIDDNTILIFTTDNGSSAGYNWDKKTGKAYGYNAGIRGMKGSEYDGGHRVPMMIHWPNGGLNTGASFDQLAAHVDMLPTLTHLAGVPYTPNKTVDGNDLSAYLKGKKAPHRYLMTDTQRKTWPIKGKQSCVMDDEWRLIRGEELYNMKNDPGQEHNIIADNPEKAAEMQAFYEQWWADASSEFACSYIELGSEQKDYLTCHDVYLEGKIMWNQRYIREGEAMVPAHWNIDFVKGGAYTFTLRRWPEESGLALGATSDDAIKASQWWDERLQGKAMTFAKAHIKIGDDVYSAAVDNMATGVAFDLDVPLGKTQVTAYFDLIDGSVSNAFYVDVEKK